MQPYFYSLSEFFAMGKHGVFVWSCWAITVGMMLVFVLYSRKQARQAQRIATADKSSTL